MNTRALVQQFERWRAAGRAFVLGTVIETTGSTYSKAGQHILLDPAGEHAGLISGGCLEPDLLLRAATVQANDAAVVVSYDLRDDSEALWGLGLGCRGLLRLLLQPLHAGNDWQPLAKLATAMAAAEQTPATLVIASDAVDWPVGHCLTGDTHPLATVAADGAPQLLEHATTTGTVTALHWTVQPWPRLLLIGGGPDTLPVAQLAANLGWEITVTDHREAQLARARTWPATVIEAAPGDVAALTSLHTFTAIVLMSHHAATDAAWLHALADCPARYIGVLGPRARRDELLLQAGQAGTPLAERLHGPVGLDIGARGPESIALALLAEIHAVLEDRPAGSLSAGAVTAPAASA